MKKNILAIFALAAALVGGVAFGLFDKTRARLGSARGYITSKAGQFRDWGRAKFRRGSSNRRGYTELELKRAERVARKFGKSEKGDAAYKFYKEWEKTPKYK